MGKKRSRAGVGLILGQPPRFTDLSAGKDFSDKLTELVVKVSGGYSLSSNGGAGWSNYSIAMHNSLDVKAFADQTTWVRIARVTGQTNEIDASAQ